MAMTEQRQKEILAMVSAFGELVTVLSDGHPLKLIVGAQWMATMLKQLVKWDVVTHEEMCGIVDGIADRIGVEMAELEKLNNDGDSDQDAFLKMFGI